jgi:hypothetical protein
MAPTHTDCVSLSVADTGLVGWPNMLGDFSETAHTSLPPSLSSSAAATPTLRDGHHHDNSDGDPRATPESGSRSSVPRLKRLNNAQQHNVYTLCQTAEGVMKFRCSACNRCFNLKCTLLRHVRHQHQGRFVPHPCGQCGQVFKRTDHLKVHMRKIHKMVSASRSNRNSNNTSLATSSEAGGNDSALVAAAIASMANTQPLALTNAKAESHPQPLALTTASSSSSSSSSSTSVVKPESPPSIKREPAQNTLSKQESSN